jgi:alcohol dehydrogenase class IV
MIPRRIGLGDLAAEFPGNLAVWSTRSARSQFADLPLVPVGTIPKSTDVLLAIGGGTIIDQAKWAAKGADSDISIVALPTLWGSGAEASPIVVLNGMDGKEIHIDAHLLPDAIIYVEGISESAPPDLLRWASADVWAHALEGFLSPLADDETRAMLADVIKNLLHLAPTPAFERDWFEQSALACCLQAQSSVGLAHGIAHQVEFASGFGHARVISAVLPTVLAMHIETDRYAELLSAYHLEGDAINDCVTRLAKPDDASALAPLISDQWMAILRDPCTRTNGYLVRRQAVERFA